MTIEKSNHLSCPCRLTDNRVVANESGAATTAAVDAFAAACEEETRASIVAWIAAVPDRMEAQAAAGAQSISYMHTIGQLAAATSLAEAIRNKADLKDQDGNRDLSENPAPSMDSGVSTR